MANAEEETTPEETSVACQHVLFTSSIFGDTHHQFEVSFDKNGQWYDETIAAMRASLASMSPTARERSFFCELVELTRKRYRETGQSSLLDDSIRSERKALNWATTGIQRASCLTSLSQTLHLRFRLQIAVQHMSKPSMLESKKSIRF